MHRSRSAVVALVLAMLMAGCGASAGGPASTTMPLVTATTTMPAPLPSMPMASDPRDPTREPIRIAYGDAPQQFGDLSVPPSVPGAPGAGGAVRLPVVVLVHGGFWYNQYALDLMVPLAENLAAHGYAVWNIEYRRIGDDGGGYPGTLQDVAAAIDDLANLAGSYPLDLGRVSVVGHSAGGQLALWAAGRSLLRDGDPGARPVVTARLTIGLGPVVDLRLGAADDLDGGAVQEFLGGTAAEVPDRYRVAMPRGDAAGHLVIVRADADDHVPARYTLPDPLGSVEVIDIPEEDHFDLIDPASASWAEVLRALARYG